MQLGRHTEVVDADTLAQRAGMSSEEVTELKAISARAYDRVFKNAEGLIDLRELIEGNQRMNPIKA